MNEFELSYIFCDILKKIQRENTASKKTKVLVKSMCSSGKLIH